MQEIEGYSTDIPIISHLFPFEKLKCRLLAKPLVYPFTFAVNMIRTLFLLSLIWLISCSSDSPTAQDIVDKAIEASGTQKLNDATASFIFRDIRYTYSSENGKYAYTRIQTDSIGNEVKDVLTNQGLVRFINGQKSDISEEKRAAYTSSVNSVIYFAFLPKSLNDDAVNKSLEGTIEIDGKSYYKIKVTFDVEGGGEDYEDVFYYWFDMEDYSMDYLAYSYNEEDEGTGMRFRVAYNTRKIDGVVIQDYKNLKPKIKDSTPLSEIDQAYINGELTKLSLIELDALEISF
ncbi:DUF6503 family protein [Ekhidna sp.]|uniref:DUF6503 family protein n=1 Tax=Ekhidna sp. TaxID=2608089 RepID=UPI003BAC0D33